MKNMGNCNAQPAWREAENVIKKYNEFIRASNNNMFP